MCLKISDKYQCKYEYENGCIVGYKLLTKIDDSRFVTPFMGYSWGFGRTTSSRDSVALTQEEKDTNEVQKGIHLFLNKKDAIATCIHFNWTNDYVCKVLVHPKDVVAPGMWEERHPSFVAHEVYSREEDVQEVYNPE
jgi:hypothetical protein